MNAIITFLCYNVLTCVLYFRLFGNEDVDLRQLPQVDEVNAPPPPSITGSPKSDNKVDDDVPMVSPPKGSPKRDWNEIKKREKTPSKLDLVRAKFAEVTKGKDRLGRPLLFSKSPSKYFIVMSIFYFILFYFFILQFKTYFTQRLISFYLL